MQPSIVLIMPAGWPRVATTPVNFVVNCFVNNYTVNFAADYYECRLRQSEKSYYLMAGVIVGRTAGLLPSCER